MQKIGNTITSVYDVGKLAIGIDPMTILDAHIDNAKKDKERWDMIMSNLSDLIPIVKRGVTNIKEFGPNKKEPMRGGKYLDAQMDELYKLLSDVKNSFDGKTILQLLKKGDASVLSVYYDTIPPEGVVFGYNPKEDVFYVNQRIIPNACDIVLNLLLVLEKCMKEVNTKGMKGSGPSFYKYTQRGGGDSVEEILLSCCCCCEGSDCCDNAELSSSMNWRYENMNDPGILYTANMYAPIINGQMTRGNVDPMTRGSVEKIALDKAAHEAYIKEKEAIEQMRQTENANKEEATRARRAKEEAEFQKGEEKRANDKKERELKEQQEILLQENCKSYINIEDIYNNYDKTINPDIEKKNHGYFPGIQIQLCYLIQNSDKKVDLEKVKQIKEEIQNTYEFSKPTFNLFGSSLNANCLKLVKTKRAREKQELDAKLEISRQAARVKQALFEENCKMAIDITSIYNEYASKITPPLSTEDDSENREQLDGIQIQLCYLIKNKNDENDDEEINTLKSHIQTTWENNPKDFGIKLLVSFKQSIKDKRSKEALVQVGGWMKQHKNIAMKDGTFRPIYYNDKQRGKQFIQQMIKRKGKLVASYIEVPRDKHV